MVVHHEEKSIRGCLESIKGLVDEIIVVHDGPCHDKTLEISRGYTEMIFERHRAGFMEAHLPFALDAASNDWILRIDADEMLSSELAGKIKELADGRSADAYEFLWPMWNGKSEISRSWPFKLALFRKSRISFLGIPHQAIGVQGVTARTALKLLHRPGYDNYSFSSFREKWLSWAELQAEIYAGPFDRVARFNYPGRDWPWKIRLRKKCPLVLMPIEFASVFVKTLSERAGWADFFPKLKYAILAGLYRLMVDYYLIGKK